MNITDVREYETFDCYPNAKAAFMVTADNIDEILATLEANFGPGEARTFDEDQSAGTWYYTEVGPHMAITLTEWEQAKFAIENFEGKEIQPQELTAEFILDLITWVKK